MRISWKNHQRLLSDALTTLNKIVLQRHSVEDCVYRVITNLVKDYINLLGRR
jgi:hypothetical protein